MALWKLDNNTWPRGLSWTKGYLGVNKDYGDYTMWVHSGPFFFLQRGYRHPPSCNRRGLFHVEQASARPAIKLPVEETDDKGILDMPSARAGKFLAFDGSGNPMVGMPLGSAVVVSPFMATVLDDITAAAARATLGTVALQTVYTQTGAMSTGTTAIPLDNTTPQNNEGDEYMTLAITPLSATSILRIEAQAFTSVDSAPNHMIMALFRDSTADALAVAAHGMQTAQGFNTLHIDHSIVSGSTSPTTFKIRLGRSSSGTLTFNGITGVAYFNGKASSYMKITEIMA